VTNHNNAKTAADGNEPYCQTCAEGHLCPCTCLTSSPVQMLRTISVWGPGPPGHPADAGAGCYS